MATSRSIRRKNEKHLVKATLGEALQGVEQIKQVLAVAHMIIAGLAGESAGELLELVDSLIKGEANLRAQRGEPFSMVEVAAIVKQTVADFKLSLAEEDVSVEVSNG